MEIIIPPGMEVPSQEDGGPSEDDRDLRRPSILVGPMSGAPAFAPQRVSAKDHKAPTPKYPTRSSPPRVHGEEEKPKKIWHELEGVVVEVEIGPWPSAT